MCHVFEVSRSGFYAFIKRVPSKRMCQDIVIKTVLKPSFVEHHKTYGPQRMSKILNKMGIPVGRTRVRRLMNECNLVPVTRRPFINY